MLDWISSIFSPMDEPAQPLRARLVEPPSREPAQWPAGVPRHYPKLSALDIYDFLSDAEFERIKTLPLLQVWPLAEAEARAPLATFGAGLSYALIRNLMLVRELSVVGPEDTPVAPLESIQKFIEAGLAADQTILSGRVLDLAPYHVEFILHPPEGDVISWQVHALTLEELLKEGCERVVREMGGTLSLELREKWRWKSWPDTRMIQQLGALVLGQGELDPKLSLELLEACPDFALPAWLIEEIRANRDVILRALRADPHNAQICFQLYCGFAEDRRPAPWAGQYTRRAIELSPGHGKAHLCMLQTAPAELKLIHHYELAHHLLPDNSSAIILYYRALERQRGDPEIMTQLIESLIELDPEDASGYELAIDFLTKAGKYNLALRVGARLAELYGPPINQHTLLCLQRSQRTAMMLKYGDWVPAESHAEKMDEIRQLVRILRRGRR